MHIWIVNHYAIPPTQGGITRHFNLAKYLVKKGHEVVIFACNYNHFTKQKLFHDKNNKSHFLIIEGVRFVFIDSVAYKDNSPKRLLNMLVFALRVFFLNKKNPHGPDVIIGSSPDPFSVLAAQLLADKYKVPFFYEIRDLWPETLSSLNIFSPRHPLMLFFGWVERRLVEKSAGIISVIPYLGRYLEKLNYVDKSILFLPNGVDLSEIPAVAFGQKNEHLIFMYAGSHGVANGLDVVIKAAKILEDEGLGSKVKIVLLGDGAEKKNLKQLTKDLQVSCVEFWDMVPKKQVYLELKKADVFLMLLKEASVFQWGISPNKIYDYFAMSRPVIFGISSKNNPVMENKAGITISPSDPNELAMAMKKFIFMSVLEREQMGRNARRYVEDNADVGKLAGKLESMLEKIIK